MSPDLCYDLTMRIYLALRPIYASILNMRFVIINNRSFMLPLFVHSFLSDISNPNRFSFCVYFCTLLSFDERKLLVSSYHVPFNIIIYTLSRLWCMWKSSGLRCGNLYDEAILRVYHIIKIVRFMNQIINARTIGSLFLTFPSANG